ncbi:hypothetical protein HG536_0D04450 [Torulaspora globosa]|uniref:DUF962 domain-containing protein n=1 Tax=Torulaspora globosa TaxID=48254 RepID=A0A7G3ZHD7_9SACH|nr:uncharacterized protein HG536_0D04450 [Torulaspora globosa]QLL32923.1 hypothetical protein HG536_0D04450 [Torulaspora globosa]
MLSPTALDLRSQLRFYKSYHRQKANVAIHAVFVPTILFATMCMLHRVELYRGTTLTHVFTLGYSVYYLLLSLPVGLLATGILVLANVALDRKWVHMSLASELALFVLGWVCQFTGHAFFEKKRPALVDNLLQSLVLAPYFILFELLFKLGFMPQLHAQLESDLSELTQDDRALLR